jgi:hypothetical protein
VQLNRVDTNPEDPSSEKWLQYYREAKVRRRARSPQNRTRAQLKRWRNRERALILGGFVVVGVVVAVCYSLLVR